MNEAELHKRIAELETDLAEVHTRYRALEERIATSEAILADHEERINALAKLIARNRRVTSMFEPIGGPRQGFPGPLGEP